MTISTKIRIPNTIKYIIKRTLITIPVFIGVVGIVWIACNFIPGIPKEYHIIPPFQQVWYLLKNYIPHTLQLAIIPLIIIPFLALKTGMYTASHRGSKSEFFIRIGTLMMISLPVFWVALIVQHLFTIPIPKWTFGIINIPVVGE